MDKFTQENGRRYRKYRMTAQLLCIGDRMRASIFRPCLRVLPGTTLEGALRSQFPNPDRCVYTVGRLIRYKVDSLAYAPRDRALNTSVVPIQTEFLTDVEAEIYILLNDWTVKFPEKFTLRIGAMRAHGFGIAEMEMTKDKIEPESKGGYLYTRIPDTTKWKNALGIKNVLSPVYGYLPIPERGAITYYQRSLFENTYLCADDVILADTPQKTEEPITFDRDPIAPILVSLAKENPPQNLPAHLLNSVADVLAKYGYAIADLFLGDKSTKKTSDEKQVEAIKKHIAFLRTVQPTSNNPTLGASIIKRLNLINEWKDSFQPPADCQEPPRADPTPDPLEKEINSVIESIKKSQAYEQVKKFKGKFVIALADAYALYGGEKTLQRLNESQQRWRASVRKGQPEDVVDLAREIVQTIDSSTLLPSHPQIARLVIRSLQKDSQPSKQHSTQRRFER